MLSSNNGSSNSLNDEEELIQVSGSQGWSDAFPFHLELSACDHVILQVVGLSSLTSYARCDIHSLS